MKKLGKSNSTTRMLLGPYSVWAAIFIIVPLIFIAYYAYVSTAQTMHVFPVYTIMRHFLHILVDYTYSKPLNTSYDCEHRQLTMNNIRCIIHPSITSPKEVLKKGE